MKLTAALLERMATDEAMGVEFPDDGPSHFPDGSDAVVCTNCAERIIEMLGQGDVYGVEERNNTGMAVLGDDPFSGHDWAVLDGRWLVDAWAKNVLGSSSRAVFDLLDPDDRIEIRRLYGDPRHWKLRTQTGHTWTWISAIPAAFINAR